MARRRLGVPMPVFEMLADPYHSGALNASSLVDVLNAPLRALFWAVTVLATAKICASHRGLRFLMPEMEQAEAAAAAIVPSWLVAGGRLATWGACAFYCARAVQYLPTVKGAGDQVLTQLSRRHWGLMAVATVAWAVLFEVTVAYVLGHQHSGEGNDAAPGVVFG